MTQTITFNTEGLYRLANQSAGDVLKAAKEGTEWADFKTAEGKAKMVKLTEAGGLTVESKTVMAINSTTMMRAAALFSIEKQLGHIRTSIVKISESLESEKEADIKAALTLQSRSLAEYKHNWNNERFVDADYTKILDMQQTAYKQMDTYEGQITKPVSGKSGLSRKPKRDKVRKEVEKGFGYLLVDKPIGHILLLGAGGVCRTTESITISELEDLIGRLWLVRELERIFYILKGTFKWKEAHI